MTTKRLSLLFCGLSGVLMSVPWLVPHSGFVALFGFVPLLCADRIASGTGQKGFFWLHYATFVLWNALTTFWVCNATVGGGIAAVLLNALQMSAVFAVFRLSKKRFGGALPYVLLCCLWIAWERWYLRSAEISWPWLVLGNAFARSTRLVQWYEYTGSLGGSLWIWLSNLGIFGLMVSLSDGSFARWNGKARTAALLAPVLVLLAPPVISAVIYRNFAEDSSCGKLDVAICQPDFDPYEKFESMSQKEQNDVFLSLAGDVLEDRADSSTVLLLAPETFTGGVYLNTLKAGQTWRDFDSFLSDRPGVNLLYGATTYEIFNRRSAPSLLAREWGKGWIETHNSALMQDWTGRTEVFHKSKLVVGTELTPYPKVFVPLDNMLGGVMGRCVGQKDISLLNVVSSDGEAVPLGCAVCYESVYGEYCTGYVRKGARMLSVITNDAWWGDTPGYRQHLSYSCLRAIELRRDIARCANTGISAFIDQRGDILSESEWWARTSMKGSVNLSDRQTFFVRYGDIAGRACSFGAVLLLLALLVAFITGKNFSRRG